MGSFPSLPIVDPNKAIEGAKEVALKYEELREKKFEAITSFQSQASTDLTSSLNQGMQTLAQICVSSIEANKEAEKDFTHLLEVISQGVVGQLDSIAKILVPLNAQGVDKEVQKMELSVVTKTIESVKKTMEEIAKTGQECVKEYLKDNIEFQGKVVGIIGEISMNTGRTLDELIKSVHE